MHRVTYLPSNISLDVDTGANLRDPALANGVEIANTCGGVGSCGLCKIKIISGAEQINPLTPSEISKLGNVFFITKERLSCQVTVSGPVTCEVPDNSAEKSRRVEKQRILSREHGLSRLSQRQKK